MANNWLNIPHAIDIETNEYIKPHEANHNAPKGRYLCREPNCKKPVRMILRNNGVCFFRHYPDDYSCSHHKSQTTHTKAINEIYNQFVNWQQHRLTMPILMINTRSGMKEVVPFLPEFKIEIEWRLNGKRKIDLAILDLNNRPILLIEVLNKHKVDSQKEKDLINYPWIEVCAKSILSNPRFLKVERHHYLPQEYADVLQLNLGLH